MILLKHKPVLLNHFEPNRIYDVGDYVQNNNTYLSSNAYKFGSHSMKAQPKFNAASGGGNYLTFTVKGIDFYKEFTYSAWLYIDFMDWYRLYHNLNFNLFYVDMGYRGVEFYFGIGWSYFINNNIFNNGVTVCNKFINDGPQTMLGKNMLLNEYDKKWSHFEICKDTNGYLYFFLNGNLLNKFEDITFQRSIPKSANFNILAGATYVDEILVTQHCLHTSSFTPYTEPYYWFDGNKLYLDNNNIYGKEIGSEELNKIYI